MNAIAELLRRQDDGLKLIRSTPSQDSFFTGDWKFALIDGSVRSMKTQAASVYVSAFARDTCVTLSDGTLHHVRPPELRGKDVKIWIVVQEEEYLGAPIYDKLFTRDEYKVVEDEHEKKLRAWTPWATDEDFDGDAKLIPGPPLIPDRFYEVKSWANKGLNAFDLIEVKSTGGKTAKIYGHSAKSDPKAGEKVDLIWIDEKLHHENYLAECISRLPSRLIWTSFSGGDSTGEMLRLSDLARQQAEQVAAGNRDSARVQVFTWTIKDNPFASRDEKEQLSELLSDEQRAVRVDGNYRQDTIRMYPRYDRSLHSVFMRDPDHNDKLARAIQQNEMMPPSDWTREIVLDPGTRRPGVLFCSIPPKEFWSNGEPYFVIYNEIYDGRMDATELAQKIHEYEPFAHYSRFIIDGRAGRITPTGFSGTVQGHYSKQFEKFHLKCDLTDTGFIHGCDDFSLRHALLNGWMKPRQGTLPRLRILEHRCPHLSQQLRTNNMKVLPGGIVSDLPFGHQKDDLRECLEYWAGSDPRYTAKETDLPEDPRLRSLMMYESLRPEQAKTGSFSFGPATASTI